MLRRAMLILALAGLAIASYLSITHATGGEAMCVAGGGGCAKVQNSPHLEILGVYIPYLAVGGFAGVAVSLLAARPQLATVVLGYLGVVMTTYVLYLQAAVIHAWCPWCLLSTALMWALAGLATWRYLRAEDEPGILPAHAGDPPRRAPRPARARAAGQLLHRPRGGRADARRHHVRRGREGHPRRR